MNSRIRPTLYIPLNPDYVAAHSIRSLCSNKRYLICRKFSYSFLFVIIRL